MQHGIFSKISKIQRGNMQAVIFFQLFPVLVKVDAITFEVNMTNHFLFFLDLKSIMQSAKLQALVSKKGLRWHSVEWIVLI